MSPCVKVLCRASNSQRCLVEASSFPEAIDRWNSSPANVTANGIDFHYLEIGTGPLVLCLHGFPDCAYTYRYLLPVVAAAGFRGVAPFMRGYAPTSNAPDGRYDSILLGQDAAAPASSFSRSKSSLNRPRKSPPRRSGTRSAAHSRAASALRDKAAWIFYNR
jgi:pimeloyl-ACP methyl ester carboxylesterase